jgi:hypothetical protein
MTRKPTDEVQLKLRFSEALRRRLERVAARNNRSMNTEIIHRLEESLKNDTAEFYRGMKQLNDFMAQQGRTHSPFGAPLAEINEKLDKIIGQLDAEEAEDNGEQK